MWIICSAEQVECVGTVDHQLYRLYAMRGSRGASPVLSTRRMWSVYFAACAYLLQPLCHLAAVGDNKWHSSCIYVQVRRGRVRISVVFPTHDDVVISFETHSRLELSSGVA